MSSPTSPRNPLTRALFFLAQAEALPGTEREAFDHYLQASIVFGRSVYHYLQSLSESSGVDVEYRQWFRARSTKMKADPVLEYFRSSRDLLLKERHVPVARRICATASASVYISVNRPDFGGDSIALKEDGVHDRYHRPPKLPSLSA